MHDENRHIWELAPVGIAKVEQSGKFLSVNPRFCEITGYSETELKARTFQQITHPDDLAADVSEAQNLATGDGDSYQMVKRYISKDGRTVWVSLYVNAVREANGGFVMFLVFVVELLHIHSSGAATVTASGPSVGISFWQYFRANPKEALMIIGGIITAVKSGNIIDFIKTWTK